MEGYITLGKAAEAQYTQKRSRFIGAAAPVPDEAGAAAFIAERRARNRDASHNCYAYSLRTGISRYSDDGEPQGTAGIPILEVLRKEGITSSVIVVTRYFGGVLLGAGGLVRAYTQAAKLAVEACGRREIHPCTLFSLKLGYPVYEKINALLHGMGAVVTGSDFGELVTLDLRIPSTDFPKLSHEISEISGGSVKPDILGQDYC